MAYSAGRPLQAICSFGAPNSAGNLLVFMPTWTLCGWPTSNVINLVIGRIGGERQRETENVSGTRPAFLVTTRPSIRKDTDIGRAGTFEDHLLSRHTLAVPEAADLDARESGHDGCPGLG
jgi:hypothetical protein